MDLKLTLQPKKNNKKKEKKEEKKHRKCNYIAWFLQFSHTLKLNHEPKNKREIYDGV